MTYLAVPITSDSVADGLKSITQAADSRADLVELRLDYLPDLDVFQVPSLVQAVREAGMIALATCRPVWEGGQYQGSEASRLNILQSADKAGADYIDIEWQAIVKAEAAFGPFKDSCSARVIVSNHDFEGCPADLLQRVDAIKALDPDVVKIAYTARTTLESFHALDLLRDGVLAMAMGDKGLITRLLASKLRALLMFASLTRETGSAPGQVGVEQVKQMYRWDRLDAETRTFGVIGSPVAHSMSPAIFNAAFSECHVNGLYLPLLVDPDYDVFAGFLDNLRERPWLGAQGFSVTIPHKENAMRYLREHNGKIEPLAEKIGAVNTFLVGDDGQLSGYNTDYIGAMNPIRLSLDKNNVNVANLPVAVIGAGGVARAIVAGLCDSGCRVTIYNRTVEKSQRLAEGFGCEAGMLSEIQGGQCPPYRLLINCTSLGMHPNVADSPLPSGCLSPETTVFDTVYNPVETRLLREARAAGAVVIDGVQMFVEQAAAQFRWFTNKDAPIELMRRVVESKLS
jgi:3-dehydroquinate dehydratase/shikimate dehydrogenase